MNVERGREKIDNMERGEDIEIVDYNHILIKTSIFWLLRQLQ